MAILRFLINFLRGKTLYTLSYYISNGLQGKVFSLRVKTLNSWAKKVKDGTNTKRRKTEGRKEEGKERKERKKEKEKEIS